jgi:hypothetical protein
MRKGEGEAGGKQRTYILLKHNKNHGNYNCDRQKYSFGISDGNNVFRDVGEGGLKEESMEGRGIHGRSLRRLGPLVPL